MSYVVRSIQINGPTVYYTGKAGNEFVSQFPKNAFRYELLEGARRKARILNDTIDPRYYFVAVNPCFGCGTELDIDGSEGNQCDYCRIVDGKLS